MPKNDWNEYKRLFLSDQIENKQFRLMVMEKLSKLSDDVSGLKIKAAIAGGAAGVVGTALVSFAVSLWK